MNSPKRENYLAREQKDTQTTFNEIIKEIEQQKLIFLFICDDLTSVSS